MSTQIISPVYTSDVSDISQLTQKIRRYKKSALTEQGINILWDIYKNPHSVSEEDRNLLMSYGPRIILIGLATANEHRDKLVTFQDFHSLCCDYLNIKDSIADKQFLENEAKEIINELYSADKEKFKIPPQYIKAEDIRFICEVLFLERIEVFQNYKASIGIEQLFFAWEVFSKLDKILKGKPTKIIEKIFNIEPLNFIRSAFGLFVLGSQKNGRISFKEAIDCDEKFLDKWNIDLETCRLVASKLSYDESKLKEWHKKTLTLNPFYQKYHSNLLLNSPLIHKDTHTDERERVYLMPSPTHFIPAFIDSLFSNLCQNDQQNDIMSIMGKQVLEPYIENALKCIFGNQNVYKIPEEVDDDKKTDFYVQHAKCDLIFEIKTSIAGYQAQALMGIMPGSV